MFCSNDCIYEYRSPIKDKKCRGCGDVFKTRSVIKMYCSVKCRQKSNYEPVRPLQMIKCPGCSDMFMQDNLLQKYCKRSCRIVNPPKKIPPKLVKCLYCREIFQQKRSIQKYCKKLCANIFNGNKAYYIKRNAELDNNPLDPTHKKV